MTWKTQKPRAVWTKDAGDTALRCTADGRTMPGRGGSNHSCCRLAISRLSSLFLLGCWLLSVGGTSAAEWTKEKKQAVTEYMQQFRRDWTLQDTELLTKGNVTHAEANVFVNGRPVNLRLKADDGRLIPIEVLGDSILVNGKDISGNLGSKTTTGANSPIIEDVSNSQITTGNSSPINQKRSNYTISISLSVALSLSVVFNLYLLQQMRKRKIAARKDTKNAA